MEMDLLSVVGICGRDKEIQDLQACLGQVLAEGSPQIAWIEGEAGAGKSSLAQELLKRNATAVSDSDNFSILFGQSKFEEAAQEPSQTIINCFDSLIHGLLLLAEEEEEQDEVFTRQPTLWAKRISRSLRQHEVREIARHSKAFRRLIGTENHKKKDGDGVDDDDDTAATESSPGRSSHSFSKYLSIPSMQHQEEQRGLEFLWLALHSLCQCLCYHGVLVLILDDWQWADSSCYHTLEAIIDTRQAKNVMIVATSRPETTKGTKVARLNSVTSVIQLGPLKLDGIHDILIRSTRRKECKDLAAIVLQMTGGNSFFVTHLTQMLAQKGLLYFQESSSTWEYDIGRIKAETIFTSELSEVLIERVRALPSEVQEALKVAALLQQTTFDVNMLQRLVKDNPDFTEQARSTLDTGLKETVEAGLIQCCCSERQFKFVHDRIRESIRDKLLPTEMAQQNLHYRIGRNVLLLAREDEDRDGRLFLLAVQHLNLGRGADLALEQIHEELASLNLEAAKTACTRALFSAASRFCLAGLELFSADEVWDTHYNLALQLTTTQCAVLYSQGNLDGCERVARSVLRQAKGILDQADVYHTLVKCLIQQQKAHAAVDLLRKILWKLGINVPPSSVLKITNVLRTIRSLFKLRALGTERLHTLPSVEDPWIDRSFEFLHLLVEISHIVGNTDLRRFATTKVVSMMLRRGKSKFFELDVILTAGISVALGRYDLAKKLRDVAISSIDKSTPLAVYVKAKTIGNYVVDHWSKPLTTCLEDSIAIKTFVMEAGMIDEIFFASRCYSMFYFESGLNLKPLRIDIKKTCDMLRDFDSQRWLLIIEPFLQFLHNLMGMSPDPIVLTGDVMNQDAAINVCVQSNDSRAIHIINLHRMLLAYIFNDYVLAVTMSTTLLPSEDPMAMFCTRLLFEGLAHFAVAIETGRSASTRKGRLILRRIKHIQSKGCPNVFHFIALLGAEEATLSTARSLEFPNIQMAYDRAIRAAGRLGILHIQAISNERAGLFCLRQNEISWASTYLTRAWVLYEEWGASAKSTQLQETHTHLICTDISSLSQTNMFLRSRERFEFGNLVQRTRSNSFDVEDLESI
eukprot:scaffold1697_cov180-Amphora_coffeaeformis.AAC.34